MSNAASSANDQISYAARSDVGMKRPMNQDAWDVSLGDDVDWTKLGHRFIVADGMGAHAAGELASQLAVEEVGRHFATDDNRPPRETLARALRAANATIHQRGHADRRLYNMGTTCSSLVVLPDGALVAHVGDSRVYRCRDETIHQLTFDHSLVWEMRAAGQIRDSDSGTRIPRNVITRCLGPHQDVDVDVEGYFSISKGDTFLLCSDGLTGRISDAEIGAIIRHLEPAPAADFLVDLANLRGGSDNITVIVVRIVGDQLAAKGDVALATSKRRGDTHPAWWFAAGSGLLMALICYQLQQVPLALLGLAISLLAISGGVWLWLQKRSQHSDATFALPTPPYATSTTNVDGQFVEGICETLQSVLDYLHPDRDKLSDLAAEIRAMLTTEQDGNKAELCQHLANLSARLREQL